ncbi:MAG: S-layer homology domain-containing protein, partial [Clostridiales bacterium]|nr:S-layer homology domain-containing protein [Clostridiales bacterium]
SLKALNDYADKDKVSKNLYEYVASAIYNNLMIGYEENGIKLFKPTATLKRAEAASLLLSVVKEEKIVFDVEEKVVMGNSDFTLELTYIEGGVILNWNYETDKAVSEYKVVASKSNENPIYPTDGYTKYIQSNSTTIYIGDSYNNGDFLKFEPGEEYYFSITALAGDEKISSNVIRAMMPAAISTEGRVPVVRVSQLEDSILVQWNEISTQGLRGYKIVASTSNPNPAYSEDGYAFWITDLSVRSKEIYVNANYNGGDLGGKFIADENYYVSVTAVYSDAKVPGNAILITMPE